VKDIPFLHKVALFFGCVLFGIVIGIILSIVWVIVTGAIWIFLFKEELAIEDVSLAKFFSFSLWMLFALLTGNKIYSHLLKDWRRQAGIKK